MINTKKLLCELIALPSVNPAFLPPGHKRAGEKSVAEFLASIAAQSGLDVEFQKVAPHRHNLIARLTPSGAVQTRILLAPHMDTVDGPEEQFVPIRKRGRIYGRGACDTKGSVAAMLAAICGVSRGGKRPAHTEIVFAGLVDEEDGQLGSRALAAGGMSGNLAIVGEPTKLQLVAAHKGNMWIEFETFGKAAHGSRPELGRNAVHVMSRLVHLLETTYASKLRRRRHKLLGHPTINVGVIRGGVQANIVPDRCVAIADRRMLPGETEADVKREIRTLLRHSRIYARFHNSKQASCLPMETDAGLPLVRDFLKVLGQKRAAGVDYFCDASVLAAAGIPSVVFGPGDVAQAHTADEWIATESLEQGAALLKRFLQSLP